MVPSYFKIEILAKCCSSMQQRVIIVFKTNCDGYSSQRSYSENIILILIDHCNLWMDAVSYMLTKMEICEKIAVENIFPDR